MNKKNPQSPDTPIEKIIIEDENGGYVVAERINDITTASGKPIRRYVQKSYWHDLGSAVRDEF